MMNNDLGMSAHLEHSGIFRDNEVLSSSYSTGIVLFLHEVIRYNMNDKVNR